MGARVELIGVVGRDVAGEQEAALCAEAGLGSRGLVIDASRPTTRKLRVVARHQHVLRLDWEEAQGCAAEPLVKAIESLAASEPPDVIVLSDYAKGVLSEPVVTFVIAWARKHGVPVLVDPKRNDFAVYAGATVITPNAKELAAATGRESSDLGVIERGARTLITAAGCEALIVTLGENGMLVVPADKPALHISAAAREVYDVTGAGDTVIALLALGLATRLPLESSASLANVAAGLVVQKVGTAVVTAPELVSAFAPTVEGKVVDRAELVERLAWWRLQKKTVVLTNGCFDILHAGHVQLLREAKKQGDILVVAINSDASVTRLKGHGRPTCPRKRTRLHFGRIRERRRGRRL